MISRGQNFRPVELNIVGSSIFGRYPKISIEKTYNMFQSDTFMVPYAGYQIALPASNFQNGLSGRGIFSSTKLNKLVVVIDSSVYLVDLFFNQNSDMTFDSQTNFIGNLQTAVGPVYITENNAPQIAISDGKAIYIYDVTQNPPTFSVASTPGFTPGYITFHDTYFICAASNDTDSGSLLNNTWRLSENNNGLVWPTNSSGVTSIGYLQTKPDNTQAVVRMPSKGNMILVMGKTVTEAWTDTGAQLFPYQRTNQFNIDYGCLNPATVAYMDEIVVWLAANEKSGAIIMYSDGGMPQKITTDGIDYLFSQMTNPADSQGFLYRQDGHLFYHINFYTDNISLFYDFNMQKFYHASDQNLNYFIAAEVAFFNNQYYFVSKNTGNLYAFDTIFTTYEDTDMGGNVNEYEIPRFRSCRNIRLPSQEYFVANDIGFTIETGETKAQKEDLGQTSIITQNNNYLTTQDENYLIFNQDTYVYVQPRVDLSISIDGGASFGNDMPYVLNDLAYRKNKLMWWQLGLANDMVCLFKFWGMGRFVATDGIVNIRQ